MLFSKVHVTHTGLRRLSIHKEEEETFARFIEPNPLTLTSRVFLGLSEFFEYRFGFTSSIKCQMMKFLIGMVERRVWDGGMAPPPPRFCTCRRIVSQ